ncbi:MarR family transcriptional regulator [Arthrobacter sp. JZ12]|uniref:MarR family winged helix-turn-helix transcriptional regulator n=1 Tax=Arthrobacter sp. JZ12 TaxID=2654190 RepID=UPI002B481D1E|nr:MarR family transcriptional regulator [Arthrobacter sp. JZ12]
MVSSPDSAGLGDLMHAAFRGLRRKWSQQLEPFGITPHQARALRAIAQAAHAPSSAPALRLRELADMLHIAPRSATEVVDVLQENGLVQRAPDPSDRRATLVFLTSDGEELLQQIRRVRQREADEYFSQLTADDQAELKRLLRLLVPEGPAGPKAGPGAARLSQGRGSASRNAATPSRVRN